MRILIAAGLTGAALVSLAACNKPATTPAGGGGSGPAAASAGPAIAIPGPISIQDLPHRRPGLWKQVMAMDGAPPPTGPGIQLCVDANSDAKMMAAGQRIPGAHCPPPTFTRNLDGSIGMAMSCDMGANGKFSSTGTIKGDFTSSYASNSTTQMSGSPVAQMNGAHTMTATATWMGPCPAGQKGGDMTMGNGMTRNVLDDEAARSGPGA